jgi:uncharacterized protein YutE (UPF0331/DUF86 family)
MADDVVLNKVASIERCVARVREEFAGDDRNLFANQTKQDSIILNLQRACETAIDLAMYLVSTRRLGVPQDSREAFSMLQAAGLLDGALAERLQRMVGFRNVAVHDYTSLSLPVVKSIVTDRLDDFLSYARHILTTIG